MPAYSVLRRRPGFVLGVSVLLATSGGLNLAVFAIVNALWLRPVPVRDAERLIAITGMYTDPLTLPLLSTFENVAGQVATHLGLEPSLRFDAVARQMEVMGVTPGYFQLFGLEIRGRDFTDDDDRAGAEAVAIISDRLWSQAFDRRADILGSTVAAHPAAIRIIGIAPPRFEGAQRGERTDVWLPRAVFARFVRVPADRTGPLAGTQGDHGPAPSMSPGGRSDGQRRTARAGAQRRRDVAAARRRWLETQPLHEAGQSVFVDESGATTDWIRRYARSLRGVRIADLARLAATGRRMRWWRRSGPPR